MGGFEITLINNPEFMSVLNDEIKALSDKLSIQGITSQSLWRYFYRSIQAYNIQLQLGKTPTTELWAVLTKEEPVKAVAFAHWFVMTEPYNGTVFCDFIYSWNDSKIPTKMLADEWIEFGNRHSCPWFRAVVINERVFAVFKNLLNKRNYNVTKEDTINCVWRKNNG